MAQKTSILMIFELFYQKHIEGFFVFFIIFSKACLIKNVKKTQIYVILSTKHAYEIVQLLKKNKHLRSICFSKVVIMKIN